MGLFLTRACLCVARAWVAAGQTKAIKVRTHTQYEQTNVSLLYPSVKWAVMSV